MVIITIALLLLIPLLLTASSSSSSSSSSRGPPTPQRQSVRPLGLAAPRPSATVSSEAQGAVFLRTLMLGLQTKALLAEAQAPSAELRSVAVYWRWRRGRWPPSQPPLFRQVVAPRRTRSKFFFLRPAERTIVVRRRFTMWPFPHRPRLRRRCRHQRLLFRSADSATVFLSRLGR